MPASPSWAALFFGVQHVFEHAPQLPFVHSLGRLERIEVDAVAERQGGRFEDVRLFDPAAARERGARLGALEDRDVRAMALDSHAHDQASDRAVQLAPHDHLRQQLRRFCETAAQVTLRVLPLGREAVGIGVPGLTAPQHLRAHGRVRDPVDDDVQSDAVCELRPELALLGVHGADEHEARRMRDRHAFALDRVDAHGGRIEEHVGEMVVEQVDLVDVEDAAVGRGQEARLERHHPLAQSPPDIDRAGHAVLGGVERQIDDPPRPASRGQVAAARADRALCGRLRRGARERAADDDLDLGQQRREAADGGRLGRAARALHEHPADRRRDGRQQERLLEALLLDDRSERIDRDARPR